MLDPSGQSVLTAMITPAVLISACGTLILSTSQRLGRAVDRVRKLTERYKELAMGVAAQEETASEERQLIFRQLPRLMRRVRLLQRALTAFYLAVALFVLTSVIIGGGAIGALRVGEVPAVIALVGAAVLSYGALLLIVEARLALETTFAEMQFLRVLGERYAPPDVSHDP